MAARKGTPLLEWVAAVGGGAITLGLIGFIGYKAATGAESDPAAVTLRPISVHATPGGHVVEVEARNRTDSTAAGLRIEGTLRAGGTEVETSEATLSYVPGRSTRLAALIFTRDPRAHGLELRATGYERP